MVGKNELELLSSLIIKKLQEEFALKHLSHNLIRTIRVENNGEEIKIKIPAPTYNMLLYQKSKVVVYTGHGSYASKLDKEGSSFMIYPRQTRKGSYRIEPGNHKGYVDRVIRSAVEEWMSLLKEGKVIKVEGL